MRWILGVIFMAAGCTQGIGVGSNDPSNNPGANVVIPAPFTPANDVVFVDAMVAHHQMALDMAEEEIARGSDPSVVGMAERMQTMQSQEIERLQSIRSSLSDAPATPREEDPHMMADMTKLAALSGEQLDAAFLEQMIPHHAGAIQMAHRALPNLENAELSQMAKTMIDAQAQEIGEMKSMHDQVTPGD